MVVPDRRPGTDLCAPRFVRANLEGAALLDAVREQAMQVWPFYDQLQVIAVFVDRVGGFDFDVEDTVKVLSRLADPIRAAAARIDSESL